MQNNQRVHIRVNAAKAQGELKHVWRYIGYDENNYTHTPEGEALIAKFGKLGDGPYYFRAHHMLCTGNCHGAYKWGSTNAYTEDERGNPVYNWEVVDEILDIYLRNNCKPFFELGFMPLDLADPRFSRDGIKFGTFREYQRTGWACPPKDYRKWYDLIFHLVRHCAERYGKGEVLTWYWELWNEPEAEYYWKGTVEEYCKLYDYTEAALHSALEAARLAGPAPYNTYAGGKGLDFLDRFLDHCANGTNFLTGKKGTRLDYVTFHVKGGGFPFKVNAPKALPSVKKLVGQAGLCMELIKKYGYADREIVISEADPDGWAAGGLYDNINMNFRNTEYYASYVASSYHHLEKAAKAMNMDVRPLAWAFLFVAERCFEGTRAFTTQGIDKAVFNLFKMYARMGSRSLSFESSREKDILAYKDDAAAGEEPEVSGFAAAAEDGSMQVLVYSHHDDWDVEEEIEVALELANIPAADQVRVKHYRIDRTHSNAYAEWVRLGKPKYPDREQYAAMKARDGLEMYAQEKTTALHQGRITMEFTMPAHAISFIEISK